MSTSRKYHISTHRSLIVTNCFYASVTNYSKTRIVHETGMYDQPRFARAAAKEWAKNSQSEKARTLEQVTVEHVWPSGWN